MGLLDDAIREHLDLKRARGADPAEIERMEREALGPVRRGPVGTATRLEPRPDATPAEYDTGYGDDRRSRYPEAGYEEHFTDLEELQELGYHDSTAPHHHPRLGGHLHGDEDAGPGLSHEPDPEPGLWAQDPGEPAPPRRRFLRRARPSSPDDRAFPADDPYGASLPEDPAEDDGARRAAAPPPALEFNQPPKRPRFTAEPPDESFGPEPEDAPLQHPEPDWSAPEPPTHAGHDAQETTEFDVEHHLAETPALDEDVLEETPEFLQDTPEHDRLWFEQRPPRDFDFDG